MNPTKTTYRLLGPGTFDEEAQDFRDGYAIERVQTTIVGKFDTRDEARDYMLATEDERKASA
jgi:hypothetical protein